MYLGGISLFSQSRRRVQIRKRVFTRFSLCSNNRTCIPFLKYFDVSIFTFYLAKNRGLVQPLNSDINVTR
ncbi:hypothetical protein Spy49_1373 [Streptococcus pyogenes NZ131]|uniref:Uncharacterized protein n=1 Tax=Streptococcus pyogenes serotype M49 (strain NZ131) TaxID=471876 RepID=A0A0H3BYD8_STRPZ|nr:hypothetical protein Spy49_1373 [Streptococcus pyogenes NZ131]